MTGHLVEALTGRRWDPASVRREVSARSARYQRRGLQAGERVSLHLGNRLEFFAELLAVWRLGGCVVPVDGRLTAFEVERLFAAVAPRFAVVDDVVGPSLAGTRVEGVEVIDATEPCPAATTRPRERARPEDDALILFTSGSTSEPRGVVHTHASLRARRAALEERLGLASYARTLCLLPTHFGHGLICNSLFPWLAGQDLFITPPFRADILMRLGSLVDDHQITCLSSVPALWRLVLRLTRPPRGATLRRVHCGSAPLPAALWDSVRGWAGTLDVFNTYGLTETASWVAGTSIGPFTPTDGLIGEPWGATIEVRRTPDAESVEADPSVRCAPGEVGHVWIRTAALMRGYLGRDDLTRRVVVDGWLATGDLGLLDERGRLYLHGRAREEINKGGIKISPAEVDAAAASFVKVSDACAFAVDDELYGQNVGLAVALSENGDTVVRELYSWMRERLAEAKLPVRCWVLEAIPRTDRGKLSREEVHEACAHRTPLDLRRILQASRPT